MKAADLVLRWVRWYTRLLPEPLAERRVGEISADLHDHIAHERAAGVADRRIAFGVLSRMVRGLPADAVWRSRIRHWRGDLMKSFAVTLVASLAPALIGVYAIVYGAEDDAPGLVLIGSLFVLGAFVAGVRTGHKRGRASASAGR